MQTLERIWADIRRGENIDLYATVCIAFGLVILALLNIAPSEWIPPLTLTVLGLLAISNLGSRHRTEELLEKFAQSSDTVFMDEFPTSIKSDFAAAKEVWLVGVSLVGTIGNAYAEIERKLHKGDTIKILLVHPESPASELAASRSYVLADIERTNRRIYDALQILGSLKKIAPDKLEIRTIQNPLTFGARVTNPESASGVLYIEHFPYKTVGGSLPKFVLRAKDGRWYDFFKKEIQTLWNNGVEWKYDKINE
jgi:hypothetical protein